MGACTASPRGGRAAGRAQECWVDEAPRAKVPGAQVKGPSVSSP